MILNMSVILSLTAYGLWQVRLVICSGILNAVWFCCLSSAGGFAQRWLLSYAGSLCTLQACLNAAIGWLVAETKLIIRPKRFFDIAWSGFGLIFA
jgi:hypothetical protein